MNNIKIIPNQHNLPDGSQVIEWHGRLPVRIRLSNGMVFRLSQSGLYLPD